MNQLEQACQDILIHNMEYADQMIYLLYDTESPLASILSDAWIAVLMEIQDSKLKIQNPEQDPSSSIDILSAQDRSDGIQIREFKNPPQPLYRGGLINPDNPHLQEQNRIITSHNIEENKRVGLDHHEVYQTQFAPEKSTTPAPIVSTPQEGDPEGLDHQIDDIKNALISLPA
jgi:hypothetical protein